MAANTYDFIIDESLFSNEKDSTVYFGMSIIFHTLLVVASFYITIPQIPKTETVTIEFIDSSASAQPKQQSSAVASAQLAEPTAPIVNEQKDAAATKEASLEANETASQNTTHVDQSDVLIPIQKHHLKQKAQPLKKSIAKKANPAKLTATKSMAKASRTQSRAKTGVPETLDDIKAPQLDFDGVAVQEQGQLNDDDFDQDFKKIDHRSQALVQAEKNKMNHETESLLNDNNSELDGVEKDIENQDQVMQNKISQQKALNNQNYQKALAQEQAEAKAKAQAEALAREKALAAQRAQQAAAAASALAAQKAAAAKAAQQNQLARGNGNGTGNGTDTAGVGSQAGNQAGGNQANSGAVRKLEQLKQVPGNPKPSYNADERLRREQGKATFQAFVTQDGRLTQFRLLESTGFRNLDGKSLAALKKWKFYPGQQGWVEITQIWSLKGNVEEMPVLLRRAQF